MRHFIYYHVIFAHVLIKLDCVYNNWMKYVICSKNKEINFDPKTKPNELQGWF